MDDTEEPTDPTKCGAKKRQSRGGGTCKMHAGYGTDHPGVGKCKFHMGSTPAVRTSAYIEIARRAVVTYGLSREIDPRDALLEEVWRTAGAVDWLSKKVAELKDEEVVWGVTEVKQSTGKDGNSVTESAELNVWVQLYQKERRHLVEVSRIAISAGIEERRVRIAEQQGQLLADAIRQILDDLRLSPEQLAKVPQIVPQRLRELSSVAASSDN